MKPQTVIEEVADQFVVRPDEILGRRRRPDLNEARAVIAYRLWAETDMTLQAIGDAMGGRSYSTIIHLRDRHRLRSMVA